ncbi:MAG: SAM-dependent methyltransferase, partial [Aquiluna sp.]
TGAEIESPWLTRYKVIDELPLQEKAIRQYLTKQDIGRLEIKKRGVDIEPELLRKRLKLKGSGAATLIATKVGGARKALVCHEG